MEKEKIVEMAIIILIVAAVAFGAIRIFGLLGADAPTASAVKDTTEIKVSAFRFGYSPEVVTVSKGDKVKLVIDNTDTTHGIRIPELGLAGNEVIEFTADKTGEFTWYCNVMCGSGHSQMKGKLIIR
ncbi:MAG TPA: cupredoxin domain-containing protein [Candidatus Nanoarchaeia archaeon]|nr:cupredoxin domain-containing protein [Candidatus Nanoarchaeia archaeon]